MKDYLSLIKFSHTIFAMPFALIGYFCALHINQIAFDPKVLLLVILCMIFARSAAMAFNRLIDRDIDKVNERTATREIPAGKIEPIKATAFVILSSLAFIATTYFINTLCFYLSPIALFVVLGYSYTKRFTFLCHLFLGLGLALAPVGAYLAVYPHFDSIPIIYGFAVLFWVSGFDIIYALQDQKFDKELDLQSIPSFFGTKKALSISIVLHICSAIFILAASYQLFQHNVEIGWLHILGVVLFIVLLFYQHTLVKEDDFSKINLAFFTTNGLGSLMFGFLIITDLLF